MKYSLVKLLGVVTTLIVSIVLFSKCNSTQNEKTADKNIYTKEFSRQLMDHWDSVSGTKKQWTYDVAFLARAIYLTDEKANYSFLKNYVDYFVTPGGTINGYPPEEYNLDRIQAGRNLFYLYKTTGEEKYKKAIERLVEQLKNQPRNADGGFWHKKIYPNQMWLDGIYMACPFLAQYAKEFNQPQWFDEVVKQITLLYEHALDPRTGLLYHAWDASHKERWCDPETGLSRQFWSRAIGWYSMAVIDVLDYLPSDHPGRQQLVNILQNTAKALLKVQDTESGLWYQVLNMGDKEGNYLETSGSAMFAYVFAKGSHKGYLGKEYLDAAQKAYKGLVDKMVEKDDNGHYSLTHTCGSCGLGGNPYRDGSYKYYISEKIIVNDPKGLAPFLLAGIELGR